MTIDTNAIRKLADAATDGPWTGENYRSAIAGLATGTGNHAADAEFIRAARTLVPQLCDALDAARAEIAGLTAANQRLLDRLHAATPDLVTAQQRADQAEDRATDLANRLHHAEQEIASHNKAVTAWANEAAAKDRVIEAAKVWRESSGRHARYNDTRALVAAVDALPKKAEVA
ncbi:hypothetical protein [Micromonospora aurantiaca]|uniref:Uncharacterized protein n=1 Tax=Micromonospora aurantiaca (nom. illeg.) TaxID=47850 RepID=A0A6N3JX45_9ACTN|nr:hypothetical protein [Micromonospora aurantiaca]AXH89439.1 hypothetical protein DVH21_05515 [Micromonospora aurantiaca]